MSRKDHSGLFKKGNVANPKGRPKVILPELQTLIDANKNAFKAAIIEEVHPKAVEWIRRVIEQGIAEGDAQRLKMLMEMALGKLVDEPQEFPLSEEEKIVVLKYREWKALGEKPNEPPK